MKNFEKPPQEEIPSNTAPSEQGVNNKDINIESFIDKLPQKEGAIDFSQLQRIGCGGTHDVFVYPLDLRFVIKLNRNVLEKSQTRKQNELSPKMLNEYAEGENSKNQELYKYFGQEHCLYEKVMAQRISIAQEGSSQNIEGIISMQEASNIFQNPNRKDFGTGYIEEYPSIKEDKEIYDKMNKALLGGDEFDEKDFLKFNEKLKPIFELASTDQEFTNSIKDFLLKFKNYFEASGRFIDLAGQENVLFYQQDNNWVFKIGSVVKGENKENMQEAMYALEQNPDILNQDEKLRNQFMNQLASIRLLNATGIKVGIGKIFNIQFTENQLKNLDKIKF